MNKTKFFSSLLVAVLFASTSVFTSCKDYDDDIKNLQTQIDAKALKTDLESLKTSLEGQITTLKSTLDTKVAALQAAIDKKADQTTVDALASTVADLTARVVVLETKVATIENALATYATKEELATVKAALDGKDEELATAIGDETKAREAAIEAVNQSIELQKQALEAYKKEVKEALENLGITKESVEKVAKLDGRVQAIEEAIKTFATTSDLDAVKSKVQELAKLIDENNANLNALELFVQKKLTSLVLKPDFYWEGLAGIEMPYGIEPAFKVGAKREFTYILRNAAAGKNEVDVKIESSMYFGGVCTELGQEDQLHKKVSEYGYWLVYARDSASSMQLSLGSSRFEDVYDNFLKKGYYLGPKNDLGKLFLAGDSVEFDKAGAVAKYHINPTTADLEGMNIKFYENDAEVYTRANKDSIGAVPFSPVFSYGDGNYNSVQDGILSIPFYLNKNLNLFAMFFNWARGNGIYNEDTDVYTHTGVVYDSPFIYWDGQYYAAGAGCQLPFIAAQLSKGDTIVTSDYAVVVPAEIKIEALADNKALASINGVGTDFYSHPTNGEENHMVRANHMYESAGYNYQNDTLTNGAIPMPATHAAVYDKVFKIDFVETHMSYRTYAKYGNNSYESDAFTYYQIMDDATMAALGLHYEYTLVNYTVGDNTTGESVHMEQVDKDGNPVTDKKSPYFAPRSVTADGKTISGQVATREAIGREPLVRVDLVNEDGKIVRYGYVKIRITEEEVEIPTLEVEVSFNDVYFNCGEEARITWAQMENLILAKLGDKGMTKQEFEKAYYLDVVGDYKDMPYINPSAAGSSYPPGELYTDKWEAKRFYKNDKGQYVAAYGSDDLDATLAQEIVDMAADVAAKKTPTPRITADNNWFGRVWYTPHDNSTQGHNWDEATNVLIWKFGDDAGWMNEEATNITAPAHIYRMEEAVEASYNSKGLNTKELSTVVRFVNKNTGSFIYVTMKFAPEKLHFAVADINRRVLDHWYDFKDGYKDNTADTIEVYANVPTPAILGSNITNLTEKAKILQRDPDAYPKNAFVKDLKEYWLNQNIIPTVWDLAHFNKFAEKKKDKTDPAVWANPLTAQFHFRLPVKGDNTNTIDKETGMWVNSSTTDFKTGKVFVGYAAKETADVNYWEVKGISGTTYKLYLSNEEDGSTDEEFYGQYIFASAGKKNTNPELICSIEAETGIVKYYGYDPMTPYTTDAAKAEINGAACDILNYVGMYDETGKLMKDTYLDGQDGLNGKAFTAFVEIEINSEHCYDPLLGKNCFNVRFLRPLNMWPAETKWKDAPNATQVYPIWKLVYLRDWRQYAVVPLGETQKFGAAAVSGTGLDGKDHKGDFAEGNVPYEFYNIENLYVVRNEIRSDAYQTPDKRVIPSVVNYNNIKDITLPITDIPALTGSNGTEDEWQFLKIYAFDTDEATTKEKAGAAAKGLKASAAITDYLAYTNNGGVVKEFHVYVPIALKYPWGGITNWTQKVWAVITIDPTQGNE